MCIFKIISRGSQCLSGANFGAKVRAILARLEIHTIHPVLKYTIINEVAKQAHTIPKIHFDNQKKTRITCSRNKNIYTMPDSRAKPQTYRKSKDPKNLDTSRPTFIHRHETIAATFTRRIAMREAPKNYF